MLKKVALLISIIIISTPTTVHAEDYWSLYKKDPDAFYKKMMCIDEESIEKGYYSDARQNNTESTSKKKKITKNRKDEINGGFVYGDDELHVIGAPTDPDGYTSGGYYGGYGDLKSKGYVFGCDELHIPGLPTDERGYTKPGNYGRIDK